MPIDRNAVLHVGGQILSASLAQVRDPSAVDDGHLDTLADLSVRAALALDAGIARAEERLEDEAKAAEAEAKADAAAEAETAKTKAADAAKTKASEAAPKPAPAEAPKPAPAAA